MIPARSPRLSRHGGRDGGQAFLALLSRLGIAASADLSELLVEARLRRDRSRRERGEAARGKRHIAEREHHLADCGRMADARPAELGDALDDGGAVREVDGDRVVLARGREGCGLTGLPHERLQVGPGERAEVEAREHRVAELDQAKRQAIPAGLRDVLDESRRGERREQARHGACVDARAPRDLVRAELATVGERIEHGERPLDGGDVTDGWLTGACHAILLPTF